VEAEAMTGMSRRRFLAVVGGAGLAAGLLPGCGVLSASSTGELLQSRVPLPEPFQVPLPVPPVLRPTRTVAGVDHFRLVQKQAEQEILPGLRTPVFGYDGIFPGPTIETTRGRPAEVTHVNRLPVPVAVHLHGGHTPAESDGYPTDLVMPESGVQGRHGAHGGLRVVGEGSFTYTYPMTQRAATLWYHDHRMDFTGPAVYRGLAGFHLIRDEEEDALPLPRGEREIPLMLTDRAFEEDGSFRYPAVDPTMLEEPGVEQDYMEGVLADTILVNGAPWPVHEVDAARYRLRLLNASNARRYELVLDPPPPEGDAFVQVGSDGGLLSSPVGHDRIRIAPAERFDVVVDFSTYPVGTEVTLVNRLGSGSTRNVMRFVVARRARDDSDIPDRLSEIEPLRREQAVVERDFRFRRGRSGGPGGEVMWLVNGEPFDPERVDARPELGTVELWRFSTDLHHPVHVHLDPFQVIGDRQWDSGWKDTVDIEPTEFVEVLVRFQDYPGTFVFHCHNLEHEDMMMMANFETH
jgi:spore coat protein A, manganese oxidase